MTGDELPEALDYVKRERENLRFLLAKAHLDLDVAWARIAEQRTELLWRVPIVEAATALVAHWNDAPINHRVRAGLLDALTAAIERNSE
jgi:hypothetical protein